MTKHTPEMNNSNNFKQPEALHLADYLEFSHRHVGHSPEFTAAAELRRLHAVNQEMLGALNAAEDLLHRMGMQSSDAYQEIDAAIAKAAEGAV